MLLTLFINSEHVTNLENIVKLGYSSKAMRDALASQIEQRLHEHVYFERVVRSGVRGGRGLAFPQRVRQVAEDVQRFFGGALVADTDNQLVRRFCAGEGCWKEMRVYSLTRRT